jgi:hypothetical protein
MGGISIVLAIVAVILLVALVGFAIFGGGLGRLIDRSQHADDESREPERPKHRVPNKERLDQEGPGVPSKHRHDPA